MENVESVRRIVESLYTKGDLLGFSFFSDTGELEHNESFLSDEKAIESASFFMACRLNIMKSERRLMRTTIELDDVILMYCRLCDGHVVLTFDADCDLDTAAKMIVPA